MQRVEKQWEIGAELGKTGAMVGAAYMALRQPVKEAGDFEHHLRAFGNTANMTADELAGGRKQIRAMSADVRQSNDALLSGVEVLVGKGMDGRDGGGDARHGGKWRAAATCPACH